MIIIKVYFPRPDLRAKNYQQDFIVEVQKIFEPIGVEISFAKSSDESLVQQNIFPDIAYVSVPTDDQEVVLRMLIENSSSTSESLQLNIENIDYDLEKKVRKDSLTKLLTGATFKEISDGGDLVWTALGRDRRTELLSKPTLTEADKQELKEVEAKLLPLGWSASFRRSQEDIKAMEVIRKASKLLDQDSPSQAMADPQRGVEA